MKTHSPDRTGILIVSLWIEANPLNGFRARITQTLDSSGKERATATAANPEGIYSVVRAWVEGFVGQGSEPAGTLALDPAGVHSTEGDIYDQA